MVTVGPDVYEASVSARASAIREIGRLRAIAARLVALAGAWTAVLVAGSVIGYLVVGPSGVGPSRPIDERIAGFFAAHGPLVPAGLSSLLPVIGLVVVVAIVVVLTIGDDARGRRVLPVVLGAIATAGLGAAVAAKVLKAMFTRPRPPRVVGSVGASGFSFPSSHTLVGWAILAACVVVLAKYAARASQRVAVPAIGVVAVTVPLSRLVLGVHWATDVIAGAALGAAWGTVAARLCLRPVPKEARRWSTRARVASGTTAVLIVIAIVPVSWSYVDALRYPGSADFATRTTDWLRNNGAGGVVDWVENARYARPSTGALSATQASHPFGDARSDLPTARRPRAVRVPVAVVGSVGTAIPEIAAAFDGRWVPVGDARFAHPAMYTATWRPEPNLPDVAVSSVWMDTTQLRPHVVAGTKEPGGAGWSWNARIPPAVHSRIVAAFNGGFKLRESRGGFMEDGRVATPLRVGAASFVVRRNGSVDVTAWTARDALDKSIVGVRQNLDLIVASGEPVAGLSTHDGGVWGPGDNQWQYTWRSAIGVDSTGNLVYVAGNNLDLAMLADALSQAGAVRGMELDIHRQIVSFNLFQPPPRSGGAVVARKLVPDMYPPATRYLAPDQRDFIAMIARNQR